MAEHKKVKVDAKAVEKAESTWSNFMAISKVSTYAICAILFVMWLVFIVV